MKTTPKIFSLFALTAALACLTTTVFAEPANKQHREQNSSLLSGPQVDTKASTSQPNRTFDGKPQRGQRHANMMIRLFEGLELSAEQMDQRREILAVFHTQNKTFRESHKDELDSIHQQMRAARKSDDQEKIDQLRTQMKSLRQDRPKMRDSLEQIRSILTEEQTAIFDTNLDNIMHQMMRGPQGSRESRESHRPRGPRGPQDSKKRCGENCAAQNNRQSNQNSNRPHPPRYNQKNNQDELEL